MQIQFLEGCCIMDIEKGKRPAVFLDRDGVLIQEKGYICSERDLVIFPYTAECVRKIKEKGYFAIVITNQSGVARGLFSEKTLKKMHAYLMRETGVDKVYYCPHHPKGKVERYSKVCRCRKPDIGLLEVAHKDFCIDLKNSYMVGDRASDVRTGQNMGIKTVLLESGYGTTNLEEKVQPDYILDDLRDFVQIL